MSLGSIKSDAPAIVDAFYGGEAGGTALADALFGVYNPSAKLAATMYPPEYVDQIALTEMGLTVWPRFELHEVAVGMAKRVARQCCLVAQRTRQHAHGSRSADQLWQPSRCSDGAFV